MAKNFYKIEETSAGKVKFTVNKNGDEVWVEMDLNDAEEVAIGLALVAKRARRGR